MEADASVPVQETGYDAADQAAEPAARPVDAGVFAAAGGGEGPVDVGGRDVGGEVGGAGPGCVGVVVGVGWDGVGWCGGGALERGDAAGLETRFGSHAGQDVRAVVAECSDGLHGLSAVGDGCWRRPGD